jgi:3-phenylpropionate/trans-cinnamate dioxygenase ferredoxin reductase subunit
LNIPGSHLPGVYYLRTLEDATHISAEAGPGKRAVIIGAGFIGMEIAASLTQRGVRVVVIESQPHIWPRFAGTELAGFFQEYCAQKGVTFHTGEVAVEIRGTERANSVITKTGKELPCDFVCIGIGILPSVELAQEAGLRVNNGIIVNEYLQTSHSDIYADTRSSFALEFTAFKIEKEDIFDFAVFSSTTGPVKGDRLEEFVKKKIEQWSAQNRNAEKEARQ